VRVQLRLTAALLALLVLACGEQLVGCLNRHSSPVLAAELQPIQLPKPEITAGLPLMQALAKRQTTRDFADQPLSLQTLSNLLWAAFGVNRPRELKRGLGLGRTAPSGMNRQEVELYVVLAQGVYVYDAEKNLLRPVAGGDARGTVCVGGAVHAAVTLVYVADPKLDFAQVDTGFIGQNVYLFAASEGLNAWFYSLHGPSDIAAVAAALKLPADKRPLYRQSVGFPPK
jgi:nitroreductase